MPEFFRGWRRKVGCVTLVMALAAWTLWLRSLIVMDLVIVNEGTMFLWWSPNDLAVVRTPGADIAAWRSPNWLSTAARPTELQFFDWTWQFCGFRYGYQLKGKSQAT